MSTPFDEPHVIWHPPVPAPPLWAPGGELLLPDPVRLISLNQPYAGLLFGNEHDEPAAPGPKSLETRTWVWPYEPGWLAIYATRTPDRGAYRRIFGDGYIDLLARDIAVGDLGAVLGVVWIGGCRPMCREDERAALYPFEPEFPRFVWVIGAAYRLARRIPLPRGPQKFASLKCDVIAAALDAPARGGSQ